MRLLSLGAGVQSTTLALMAAEGSLDKLDGAIFADTGWEPRAVYEHLDRLAAVLADADIPLIKVDNGSLRDETLTGRYLNLPIFVRTITDAAEAAEEAAEGRAVMVRRQCTQDFKMDPIRRHIRLMLGAKRSKSGAILAPPKGAQVEQWIGFSVDEIGRVNDKHTPPYIINRYPLLELHMTRSNCIAWLAARGWGDTPKSACIVCPFHGNRAWRDLRDNHPDEWAEAVATDELVRSRVLAGDYRSGLKGAPYFHRSLLPLAEAPIDQVSRREANVQGDLFDMLAEEGEPDGCSPYGCRSGVAA